MLSVDLEGRLCFTSPHINTHVAMPATPQCSLGQKQWMESGAEARAKKGKGMDGLKGTRGGGGVMVYEERKKCKGVIFLICWSNFEFFIWRSPPLPASVSLFLPSTPAAARTSHASSLPSSQLFFIPLRSLAVSFFINPCALHAKWAHSPIQYLPRHDGRDVYIKTNKAGGVKPHIKGVREVTRIHTAERKAAFLWDGMFA